MTSRRLRPTSHTDDASLALSAPSMASSASHSPSDLGLLSTPSIRPHRKTRSGCRTCKRRKIKCDEGRPSCHNCIKHSSRCDFVTMQRPPDASSPTPSAQSPLHLLDLELMHHFTTSTYATLTTDPVLRTLWRTAIVRKAFKSDYVMRTVLAVSALHLAQSKPDHRQDYISHATLHHQIASRAAIDLMNHISPDNCEDLWIFSVLTMFFALGSPKTPKTSLLMGDHAFPDWLFLLNGVKQILLVLESSDYSGLLTPIVKRGTVCWDAAHKPRHTSSALLKDLEAAVSASVASDSELEVYRFAISELRCQLSYVLSADCKALDMMDAFVWQFAVADGFMPLLQQNKPEAVAIFAHNCVILDALDGHKWLQGWAAFLMSRAWKVLDHERRLWIQWPMEQMGWAPP